MYHHPFQQRDSFYLNLLACLSVRRPVSPVLGGIASLITTVKTRLCKGGLTLKEPSYIFEKLKEGAAIRNALPFEAYIQEMLEDVPLKETYEGAVRTYGLTKHKDWNERVAALSTNAGLLYALIRCLRPDCIVETGTAKGATTSVLLAALSRNDHGRLISIDIPPKENELSMDFTLDAAAVGYFIPETYRDRWHYIKGDAKLKLVETLSTNPVDLFIHDSLHTRSHMLFEYATARIFTKPGGIIASDDVMWSNAFDDFLATNRLIGYAAISNPNFGFFVNSFDSFELEIGLKPIVVD